MKKKAIITGSSGFIGSNLAKYLKRKGYYIIGIDTRRPNSEDKIHIDAFHQVDLRDKEQALKYIIGADDLIMLAADMGGVGYLSSHNAVVGLNNAMINVNTMSAAMKNNIKTIFFASSACVYPTTVQDKPFSPPLSEEQSVPSQPDQQYGWEKLYSEQLLLAIARDMKINVKIGRFFAIYGPGGNFCEERAKSIQALCKKVITCKKGQSIEVWGDGKQTRTYCYISDCCEAIYQFLGSQYNGVLNIGTTEEVTIEHLTGQLISLSHKKIKVNYVKDAPQGVRGRLPSLLKITKTLRWKAKVNLKEGLKKTLPWVAEQI